MGGIFDHTSFIYHVHSIKQEESTLKENSFSVTPRNEKKKRTSMDQLKAILRRSWNPDEYPPHKRSDPS